MTFYPPPSKFVVPAAPPYEGGPPTPKPVSNPAWIVETVAEREARRQAALLASRQSLEQTSSEPSTLNVSALGQFLGPNYGLCAPAGYIYAIAAQGASWVIGVAWGVGEHDGVVQTHIDNEPLPAGASVTHYMGTTTQGVDPTLAGLISGYSDDLIYTVKGQKLGVFHSVFVIPSDLTNGLPRLAVTCRGLKVYDPRGPVTAYSTNPSLHLADIASNALYGYGRTVDWTSVGVAADANDELLVSGAKRRESGLSIQSRAPVGQWMDTLRTYAGCFIVPRGGTLFLVPNRPAASSRAFTGADYVNGGQFEATKGRGAQVPTVVSVRYTDVSKFPWRQGIARFYDDGVTAGSTEWRESPIPLPGIQSHEQAYREAKERLKQLKLSDLSVQFTVYDEALAQEIGDVITVTHPMGLTSKTCRILDIVPDGRGSYRIAAAEYDATAYSDDEVVGDSAPDTARPDPLNPPAVTGIGVVEALFQRKDGSYDTQLIISWAASDYMYVGQYEACVEVAGQTVWCGFTTDTSIPSAAVSNELVPHVVRVRIVSTVGATGDWTSDSITPQGNLLPPTDVSGLQVIEVGGEVIASWLESVDIGGVEYVIRYGPTTTAWADLDNFDISRSLRWSTKQIPPGTWRVWVTSRDLSNGIYANTPQFKDLLVTSDVDAFFIGNIDFWTLTPVLTNAFEYTQIKSAETQYFSYVSTDTITSQIPLALSNYPNPAITYHSSASSSIVSGAFDYGASYQGTFRAEIGATAVDGSTIATEMGLSTDDVSYTWGILSLNSEARYVKDRVTADTTNTFLITTADLFNARLDVVAQTERGIATTSTGGTIQVNLENTYDYVKTLYVSAGGASGEITARWDDIQLNPASPNNFDIYSFVNGTLTSGVEVAWEFKGV